MHIAAWARYINLPHARIDFTSRKLKLRNDLNPPILADNGEGEGRGKEKAGKEEEGEGGNRNEEGKVR